MKSGIALMLAAIDALRSVRRELPRPVTVLLVSDEEVGSASSRPSPKVWPSNPLGYWYLSLPSDRRER